MPRVGVCVVQGTGTLKPPAFHGTTTAIRRVVLVQYPHTCVHECTHIHTYIIYPLTCRGPVSGTQIIDTVVFLIPRGELKGGYMYLSPVAPHNRL